MFMGTPLEEPFRFVVWLVIGIPVALLIWAVASTFIDAVVAVQVGGSAPHGVGSLSR